MQMESHTTSVRTGKDRRGFVMAMSLVILVLTGVAVLTTQLGAPIF